MKWRNFQRYWPFVWGLHRSPVNSPHKGQWRGALMFFFIWINGWVNNCEAGDLRRHRGHYDVTVMIFPRSGLRLAMCTSTWQRIDRIKCCYLESHRGTKSQGLQILSFFLQEYKMLIVMRLECKMFIVIGLDKLKKNIFSTNSGYCRNCNI